MKRIHLLLLVSCLLFLNTQMFSQTISSPYEVATWSGFRDAAINYTFDDGCPNQFKIAVPLFDEFKFKLTLFTVSGWISNWSALQAAADSGHEVASHTVTHPNFGSITYTQQLTELVNSKSTIDNHITGKKCITIAYPFCVPGNDSACGRSYISARGCQGFIEPKTPGSYFNISSIGGGNLGTINTLSDFKSKFSSVAGSKGWCIFLFHGIDNDGGYSPITSTELRKSVQYLSARKSKFWVTTFANTTLYCKERNAATVTEKSATDALFTLQLTDNLPDSIYNYPLSVRRPLPLTWPSATVTQNDKEVPMRIVSVNSTVYITFDVVPDAGEIKISKSVTPVTPQIDTVPADNVDPGTVVNTQLQQISADFDVYYSEGNINISLTNTPDSNLRVSLFDVKGIALISDKHLYLNNSKLSVKLNNTLKTGIYIVAITDGKNNWNKKLIVS